MQQRYASAATFRRALEDRLNRQAHDEQVTVNRLRRTLAFERFLARLFFKKDAPWVLKGGYANELRLGGRARATKDIDLSIPDVPDSVRYAERQAAAILTLLQSAAYIDLGDWFGITVGEPMKDLDGPPEGGTRFPVMVRLDKPFSSFHVDVGLGDVFIPPSEWANGHDMLAFAGIAPPRIKLLRKEQHFAEKIHAYSLTRPRPSSRFKDLVDLMLFIESGDLKPRVVARCLRETFDCRNTHVLPAELTRPPEDWRDGYAALASECMLQATTIDAAFVVLTAYWNRLPQSLRMRTKAHTHSMARIDTRAT